MVKSTIQVTLFSLLGIAINFSIQLLLTYFFGATEDRDAYFAALAVPSYISILFTGSIGMMFLPFLVKYRTQHTEPETVGFASGVLNAVGLLLLLLVLLGIILAEPVMRVMIPHTKQSLLQTSIPLFRLQMASMLFTVMSTLLACVFQARHSFIAPALFPIVTGFITMLAVAGLSKQIGIESAALGALVGSAIAFFMMLYLVLRLFKYHWQFSWKAGGIRAVGLTALPLFTAGILFRSTTVVERFFAARLPDGSLSYLGNGNQVIVILSTIVSSGIATTSFPLLAQYWSERDLYSLEKTFIRVISFVLLITFPMIVIFALSGLDIVRFFFERGAFTPADTKALYFTLLGLMGFFVCSSIGNISMRILYLSHRTVAVAVIASFELIVYIVCALSLSGSYQYVGLALSVSIASACNILVSFIYIKKKVFDLNLKELLTRIAHILVSSLCIFLLFSLVRNYLLAGMGYFLRILVLTVSVFVSYSILMWSSFRKMGYQNFFKR